MPRSALVSAILCAVLVAALIAILRALLPGSWLTLGLLAGLVVLAVWVRTVRRRSR